MVRILFVCHGNICRSPMAEYIMKAMVSERGLSDKIVTDSAAVSREEIGNDIYPPAKRKLAEHNVPFSHHAARQIEEKDLERYNRIIVMDRSNLRILKRLFGDLKTRNIEMMMSFSGEDRDVEDPWYTGDYEQAYRDISSGCEALLHELCKEECKEG